MWFYNEHGGRYLTDYSFQGNLGELMGSDQSKLLNNTDDDGISATKNVNWLAGDQHIRVHDNPNVQLKNIHTTETGFTIFIRVFLPFLNNNTQYGKNGVLFSKLDDEQVKFGYTCQINEQGDAFFIVRDDSREYSITAIDLFPTLVNNLIPDFNQLDFNSLDYLTVLTLEGLVPAVIPYDDLAFTYEFATHRMQIIKNGVIIKDTNTNPEGTGLVGSWKLIEGGDIGNTPNNPTSYDKTVYNSIETGNNGTIANATWQTITGMPHETYLNFDGDNDNIIVNNYTAIQSNPAFTISLWYYPKAVPVVDGFIIRKNDIAAANSWLVYHQASGFVRLSIWNSSATRFDITFNSAFPNLNQWYHVVAKVTMGSTGKIFVNNVKVTGTTVTGTTLDTGTTTMIVGGSDVNNTPTGLIHDIKIWNRELTDTEVTTLFNAGHPHSGIPKWSANPPPPPTIPVPITNPFVLQYNLVKPTSGFEWIKLHKLVASGFTQVYTKPDGTTIPENTIPFATVYNVTDTSGGWSGSGGGGGGGSTVYNQTVGSSPQHLEFEGGVSRAGIKFNSGNASIGKIVTKVTAQLRKQNSPSGTASIVVRSLGGTLRTTLGTFSPGSLGSGEQTITVNYTGTYQLVADDVVSVEYPSGSNTIELTEIDPSGPNDITGFTSVVSTGGAFSNNSRLICMVIDTAAPGGGGGGGTGYPLYTVSSRSGGSDCNFGTWLTNDITHVGALITGTSSMSGKALTRITVKLSKVGNPPGSVEVSVASGDITGSRTVWGTVSAATLTTTPTDYTFTKLTNTDTMITNDSVICRPTVGGGDANNHFKVSASGTSQEAGVNLRYRVWNEADQCWTFNTQFANLYQLKSVTTQDMTGKFETGGQVTPAKLHYYNLDGGTIREVGEVLVSSSSVLSGKKITRVKPKLKAVGNPTGTIRCIIRNSSGTEVSHVGSIEANTVSPTIFEEKEFTNLLQSRSLTTGDKIMFQYTGTSTAYIQIMVKHDASASEVGSERLQTLNSSGNFTDVDADLSGTFFVGGTATDPDAYERIGEKADLTDSKLKLKKISKVLVWLRKIGNPTGTGKVFCRIRRQLDDTTIANIGEVLVSSISTAVAGTQKEFITSPVSIYAVQQDDSILIEYDDSGSDDNNYVEVAVTSTDAIDTNKSILVGFDRIFTIYDLFPTKDLIATMYSGGDTYTPTGDEIPPPPPPAYSHDLHISAGGYPYTYYTDTTTIENWIGTIAPDIRWYRKILTTNELLNIYQNRRDRSNLPKGQVCVVGYFSLPTSV